MSTTVGHAILGQRLVPEKAVLLVCDVQERFRDAIEHFSEVVGVVKRLTQVAVLLDIPIIVTEQYPKGLGKTVAELELGSLGARLFEKTKFSMMTPEVEKELADLGRTQLILSGIEAHVCVQQTALDALSVGLEVFVAADAASSRSSVDRHFALLRLREAGAVVTTAESLAFQLLGDKAHPKFKEVSTLHRALAPQPGLVPLTIHPKL